ncbi:histamine H2 receptor [Podarcis lilfordi]|uniref:Histamine H2 receptor n=1 Tax=Podarcis lilfordi TaxID=74358 RepID=A0AA35NZ44_9SAUR|nr:histamine H2 receptor [Podarcis lilfordi]
MNSTDGTSDWGQVPTAIVLAVLIIGTVFGNVMVCLAVYFNRRLRNLTNCFIVSLAFTDLLLGLMVLPFSAIYEVSSHEWIFSVTLCNIYISLDVMLCTASILNLFMISLDRYYAITAPLRYNTMVTPKRVAVAMFLIWVVSLMVSFLPIHLAWNTNGSTVQNTQLTDGKQECKLEVNAGYVLVDGLLTFYLPLLVMCITYYRIFKIAREQAKRINHTNSCTTIRNALPTVKEHKAIVTLAAVMGAFIICWFPYFTVFTYRGVTAAYNEWKEEPCCPRWHRQLWAFSLKCTQGSLKSGALGNLNPPCDKSPCPMLPCCQSLCLAKVLPKRDVWSPMFDQPVANARKTRQPSAPHTVIYCVFT